MVGPGPELVDTVNGRVERVLVDRATPLVYVLRNDLGLLSVKLGCELAVSRVRRDCRRGTITEGLASPRSFRGRRRAAFP